MRFNFGPRILYKGIAKSMSKPDKRNGNVSASVTVEAPKEVKLGSPQFFLVSIANGERILTRTCNASSWQAAVLEVTEELLGSHTPTMFDASELEQVCPTIGKLAEDMFKTTKSLLTVGVLRPAVYSLDTGYKESNDGPISVTNVNVAAEYIPLDHGVIYIK